jgi:hypothetical protein
MPASWCLVWLQQQQHKGSERVSVGCAAPSAATVKTNQHKLLLVCSPFLKSAGGSGSRKNAKFSSMERSTARCIPLYEVLESGFVLFEVSTQATHSGMLQYLTGTGCSREQGAHRDA